MKKRLLPLVIAFAAAIALFAQPAQATGSPAPLGVPQLIGYSVTNVGATTASFAAATGTKFGPVKTDVSLVRVNGSWRLVALKTAVSLRGAPFVEFVQATPAIGPWAVTATRPAPFISYTVNNVLLAGGVLAKAKFELVALSAHFSYWRGASGALVRLVDKTLAPVAGDHQSQAAVDLGAPLAVTYFPCEGNLAKQFTDGLGVPFRGPQSFALPREYSDGTTGSPVMTADISVPRGPFLVMDENGVRHGAPLEPDCATDPAFATPIFVNPDQAAAQAQLDGAGGVFIQRIPGLETEYRLAGGVFIQVVHPALVPAD